MDLPHARHSLSGTLPSTRRPMNSTATRTTKLNRVRTITALALCVVGYGSRNVAAQGPPPPTLVDPHLAVRTVASGFTTPVSIAFLGANDMLVLEKNTGRVQHVVNGATVGTAIDLAVNNNSERGLLGIALHPNFPTTPFVYLYWTCRTASSPTPPNFTDVQRQCDDSQMLGADSGVVLQVPLRGNRVDRFAWNGSSLTYDRNVIMLTGFHAAGATEPPGQGDSAEGPAGNHNGGVIRFGADGKLYIIIGDNGRRGQLQNLAMGPTPPTNDDQFGGPEPDNVHLTG